MKKLIVLICMVLCVAVIGSVLAIAVYDAPEQNGSIGTDTYLYLTMNSSRGTAITLTKGVAQVLPIVLGVESNQTDAEGTPDWGTATLTIDARANGVGKDIENVTITLCSDREGNTPITANVTTSDNTITMTGITTGQTVYVKLLLSADATEAQVNATNGILTCTFAKAA